MSVDQGVSLPFEYSFIDLFDNDDQIVLMVLEILVSLMFEH